MAQESKTLQPFLNEVNGKTDKSIYAKQISYTKDGEERYTYRYILGTEMELWNTYISKGVLTLCEVIDARKPCHLYIDIDVNLKKTPGISVTNCWETVRPIIYDNLCELYKKDAITMIVMDSSSQEKGSLHIVVKIQGKLFTNAAHCGAYMRVLQKFIETEKPEAQGAYSFFDLGIYTRNRLFRMLGQTKAGQNRFLRCVDEFTKKYLQVNDDNITFESWKRARVCPVNPSGFKLIEMLELDNTVPRFSSGSSLNSTTVVCGWVPQFIKGDMYNYLSRNVGEIERMVYMGKNMKIVCNTRNKNCIFLQRQHTSNRLYIVISLVDKCYHIKCHSTKCRNKRSEAYYFNKKFSQMIEDWLTLEVGSEPI